MTDTRRIAPILLLAALAACDQRQPLPTSPVPDAGAEMQVVPAAAPAAPSGAAATVLSTTEIWFAWTDNSNDELGFEVHRREYAGGAWSTWQLYQHKPANAQQLFDEGVTGGNTYGYRVRACQNTECSGWSVARDVVLPKLVTPTVLYVSAQSTSSARVGWTDASIGESSFRIEKRQLTDGIWGDWSNVVTAFRNTTRYDVTGLTLGGTYEFRVRACYFSECSHNGTSATFTLSAPAPPDGFATGDVQADEITLQWMDTSNEVRFQLYRATEIAPDLWTEYALIATLTQNTTTYTDTGVTTGTSYAYQIIACNPAGCSIPSGAPVVTTP